MDERNDHLWKVAQQADEHIDDMVTAGAHPLGLDVGTSRIVSARRKGREIEAAMQLNAFIPVPYSRFTETILDQSDVAYYRENNDLVIYGTATERFANMFNAEYRRPMAHGMINARERNALPVLEAMLATLVPRARTAGETLAFSVPAASEGHEAELIYHEAALRRHFEALGYRAVAINEGLAVVFSELENQNFTGIGVSCGGGMCNVALAYLSIPSIIFSIAKGGDFIDTAVGAVVNEHSTRVRILKEEGVDLTRDPQTKFDRAIQIYYENVVDSLVEALHAALSKAEKLPRTERPLPLVLSGGTAKARGFKELFEKKLRQRPLPIEVSECRMARDPLTATARGALIAAMYEK